MEETLRMEEELRRLSATGNLRSLPGGTHHGRYLERDGRRMLNLSSNDYLGLASGTDLWARFLPTLRPEDCLPTSASARLLTGDYPIARRLERLLATLYGAEAALTFGSGYHANVGILPAIATADTLILADKLVHASLIDGIRLAAPARCVRYRHNDMHQLERLMREHRNRSNGPIVVVTESIFSMDGDRAPLDTLVGLKRRYGNVMLYVDEAHAFGARGPQGLGLAEEMGLQKDIDLLIGTFGKAAASMGAFVVCKDVVCRYLMNRMRPFIFSTALPPALMAWTHHVVSQLPAMADRRRRLTDLSDRLRRALADLGIVTPSESHIIPLIVGPSTEAVQRAEALQEAGYYVLAVRPPTVPPGTSRIRLSLTAAVEPAEVEGLARAVARVWRPQAE